MPLTSNTSKVLLIGDERICKQVAYVLGIKSYVVEDLQTIQSLTKEKLTGLTYDQLYICSFRRQCRIVKKLRIKNVKFLDDICRDIDYEHKNNRRHRRESRRHLKQGSLIARIKLWGQGLLRSVLCPLIGSKTIRAAKKFRYDKVQNVEYLRWLKPSELFLFVLYAPVNGHINCSFLENNIFVSISGDVCGCCSSTVPLGNLLVDGSLENICQSTYARIIKLSSINHSYCLCDFTKWCLCYDSEEGKKLPDLKTPVDGINCINAEIDSSCNLCCKSCRNKKYVMDDVSRLKADIVLSKLLSSGYLDQTKSLILSGRGEVFYSPYYRRLLETDLKRKNIHILSNGILFNETNWNWLKNKYETIDVQISVDAATKETYSKLRGGNFDVLLKNLHMLAVLHRQGHIRNFKLNFLVQRDNFREMPAFVRLGRSLSVDCVEFQRMSNFGNLSKKELLERCLIIDEKYLDQELWQVLQDPIFQDPIVDLRGFKRYIDASKIRYENK